MTQEERSQKIFLEKVDWIHLKWKNLEKYMEESNKITFKIKEKIMKEKQKIISKTINGEPSKLQEILDRISINGIDNTLMSHLDYFMKESIDFMKDNKKIK